jgi:ribosomal protein S18 acetylase RimI-like enzyme
MVEWAYRSRVAGRSKLFEHAKLHDVKALVELRDQVARWLLERGIQQWLPSEFSAVRMQAWVERGDVFVNRRDGRIVAAVAVLDADPEIWDDDPGNAKYIHLLMVDRAHAGVGLGDAALAYAEERVRDRGGRLARLDAVASNEVLRCWYEARGYEVVGYRAFDEPELFDSVLLEKSLS